MKLNLSLKYIIHIQQALQYFFEFYLSSTINVITSFQEPLII
jgi:hypothetical protein